MATMKERQESYEKKLDEQTPPQGGSGVPEKKPIKISLDFETVQDAMSENMDKLPSHFHSADDDPKGKQVGGSYHLGRKVQLCDIEEAYNVGFYPMCVIKRMLRYDKPEQGGKGGQDIKKAIHELEILLERWERNNKTLQEVGHESKWA